jgi:two-component sensor histidine kinase
MIDGSHVAVRQTDMSDEKPGLGFRQTPAGALVEAVERLAGAATIEDVVEVVRATARRLVGSDGIAVILREGESCCYVEEDAIGPLWKGRQFPLTSCISGWAMLNKQTVAIPDIRQDARIPQDLYEDTFVRSLVMAPVRSDDPIGAIGAYWAQTYEATPEEVDTLETLSRATATAIENVRLISALSRALTQAELARDELRHRVKNAYAAAQSLATLSLPPEHARALNARLAALARAHELLDQKMSRQASITLRELIEAELAPYQTDASGRFEFEGPEVTLESAEAVALGLALNELATNALKYGALSTQAGRLRVTWHCEKDYLMLRWNESDGPDVRAAGIESFGSRLLRRLVEGQLKGILGRELNASGVSCLIEFPLVLWTDAQMVQ